MLSDSENLEKMFQTGLKSMGLPPLPWKFFSHYLEELLKWNEVINLTSITHPVEVIERHFLDSLALLNVMESVKHRVKHFENDVSAIESTNSSVKHSVKHFSGDKTPQNVSRETFLDIGTGGGFPGIPIKIALPSLSVTLVEPIKKKVDFLKAVIRKLELKNVTILHRGLEEGQVIGKYSWITSRATFKLDEMIAIAAPNLENGGAIVAMKSEEIDDEIKRALPLLTKFHLTPFEVVKYTLSFTKITRELLVSLFRKEPHYS